MQDDISIDDEPVTLLCIELGVLDESLVGQNRLEPGKVVTQMTVLESTRDIITDISLSQDCSSAVSQ
jgi:hypothetical protein